MSRWIETVRKKNHATVFMLLSLMAATNASQAVVLCIGCDGHIAIEPMGHDHCADGTHLCESDAAVHDTRLVPDAGGTHCGGCTDIPMVQAIGSDPSTCAATLAVFSQVHIPPEDGARAGFESQISDSPQGIPLSSIVLQV
jgi:hypothetical protein